MTGWSSELATAFGFPFRNSLASQDFGKGLISDMLIVLEPGYFFLLPPGLPPASLPRLPRQDPWTCAGTKVQCSAGPTLGVQGFVSSAVSHFSMLISLECMLCKGSLMGPCRTRDLILSVDHEPPLNTSHHLPGVCSLLLTPHPLAPQVHLASPSPPLPSDHCHPLPLAGVYMCTPRGLGLGACALWHPEVGHGSGRPHPELAAP